MLKIISVDHEIVAEFLSRHTTALVLSWKKGKLLQVSLKAIKEHLWNKKIPIVADLLYQNIPEKWYIYLSLSYKSYITGCNFCW